MTVIDTPIVQSIQQAIAIIKQGRELERLLIEAGFALPDSDHHHEPSAGAASPTPEPDPVTTDNAPEWPKANADGELVDVRGIGWDERIHSTKKVCLRNGSWKEKRGADPELVERLEREALVARQQQAIDLTPTEEGTGEPENKPTEFEKILAGIRSAADQREIDEWEEYSCTIVISQSQRLALEAARDERRRQLNAQAA